jgi:hypothetical protein
MIRIASDDERLREMRGESGRQTFPGTKPAGRGGSERVPDQLTVARPLHYAREASLVTRRG